MRALVAMMLGLASCTLATDATDRQVSGAIGRDLNYTFKAMSAHAGTPLDVVVAREVNTGGKEFRLFAHARIVLPPSVPGEEYPDQGLYLSNVLGGDSRLLFYADSDFSDSIAPGVTTGSPPGGEHIWDEPIPPSGIGEFTHAFNFIEFSRADYSTGSGDVVLDVSDAAADWRPPACAGQARVLEVFVTLGPDQQIGYYRNFSNNDAISKPVRLDDIVDANSNYTFVVSVDGVIVKNFSMPAPAGGEFKIPQNLWLPTPSEAPACPAVAAGQ